MSLVKEWSRVYDQTKRQIQNKRMSGQIFSSQESANILSAINQLGVLLKQLSASPHEHEISASELARRQVLLDNIKKQILSAPTTKPMPVGTTNDSASAPDKAYNPLQTSERGLIQQQHETIKMQDSIIDEIGQGVDRLHRQALNIGEETKMHVGLLDAMDSDVEIATAALQAEAKHAEKIRDSTRMCYYYICVAVEVVIIVLLLILMLAG